MVSTPTTAAIRSNRAQSIGCPSEHARWRVQCFSAYAVVCSANDLQYFECRYAFHFAPCTCHASVQLLCAGVPEKQGFVLLGRSSVRMTPSTYSACSTARETRDP